MTSLQKKAKEQLSKLELPKFKYGIGVNIPLKDLDLDRLSVSKQTIVTGENIEVRVSKELPKIQIKDKLSAFHYSHFSKKIITVKQGTTAKILIKNHLKESNCSNLLIVVEPQVNLEIIEENTSENKKQKINSQIIELQIAEDSKVSYLTLQQHDSNTFTFSKKTATLGKDSQLNWYNYPKGGKLTQEFTTTKLCGENSSTKNLSVIVGNNEEVFDFKGTTEHLASNTFSDLKTKSVLNEKSKLVFRGLVKIAEKAENCVGYQKEDTLLLSDQAQASLIPDLEIANDQVQCSHGATVSRINPEQLFYLSSRGINKEQAEKILVEGFLNSLLQEFPTKNFNLTK